MAGLLEVVALHADDARRAADGGADRVELLGSLDDDGYAPPPDLVARVCQATSLPVRPLLRLRDGFGTDGGEFVRLRGLIDAYLDAGADGVVFGFLNGLSDIDLEVCGALLDGGEFGWTFDRAVDQAFDTDRAWRDLATLPRLDAVLTAGSARGVEEGLDELLRLARADERAAALIQASGALHPDHVPWLVRAGVRQFQIASSARPGGSFKAYVDPGLVHTWRTLIDGLVARAEGAD